MGEVHLIQAGVGWPAANWRFSLSVSYSITLHRPTSFPRHVLLRVVTEAQGADASTS